MRTPWTAAGTPGDAARGTPPAGAGDAGEPGTAGDLAEPAGPRRRFGGWPAVAAPLLRRHWLAAALLLGGLVLRILTQIAYRPALLYIDTVKYLFNAWPGTDPVGYKVPLTVILFFGDLSAVAAIQHLLGLAMAVALYLVLLRRGCPRWLAALAIAPVLLDAYQLQMEQTIMPDVWFEALIVAGLAVLLWRPRPGLRAVIAAGLILGASATLRQVGEILVLPAAAFALIAAAGWRVRAGHAAALCAAFALPILGYSAISLAQDGHFRLSHSGTSELYGRMAAGADCATLRLAPYQRALCPTPRQRALGPDGLEHSAASPLKDFAPPAGVQRSKAIADFNHQVLRQQPLRILGGFGRDVVKLFTLTRFTSPGDSRRRWAARPRSSCRWPSSCAATSWAAATPRARCSVSPPWPASSDRAAWPAAAPGPAPAACAAPVPAQGGRTADPGGRPPSPASCSSAPPSRYSSSPTCSSSPGVTSSRR